MVRLQPIVYYFVLAVTGSLNSTMVRLQPLHFKVNGVNFHPSQFHYGSITTFIQTCVRESNFSRLNSTMVRLQLMKWSLD